MLDVLVVAKDALAVAESESDDTSVRHLLDLPEELLLLILRSTGSPTAVFTCATSCHAFAALSVVDSVWKHLCGKLWPLLLTTRHDPPVHLREPPVTWLDLFRSRVNAAAPANWRIVLPLYDASIMLATERPSNWVVNLGVLLLRIERVRMRDGLASPVRECHQVDTRLSAPTTPQRSEALCWFRSLQHAVCADMEPVLALASDPSATDGVGGLLDAWHELIEGGAAGGSVAAREEAAGVLQAAYTARSALAAISDALDEWCGAPWLPADGNGAPSRVRRAAERLRRATAQLDQAIHSLRREGCDLSMTAAQRGRAPVGALVDGTSSRPPPPAGALVDSGGGHWWWYIEPPTFVSGGCPFIPT